jgi:NADPH-dependent glutamate synthase beta subunit-like oxidoreductase
MVEGRTHRPIIQSSHCQNCDVCIRGCPAEFIPEYQREEKSLRGTLYRGKLKERGLKEKVTLPPCQEACPIHQDTRGYIALIAKEKFKEALELIREVNPLPAVCGFICHHPCEEACLREEVDHPIFIRLLKRFVAEYEGRKDRIKRRSKKKRRERVLVIGSGPAGLTAANDLTLLGFEATIFEALPVLGGMLAVGIPEFRLPRNILNIEIDGIRGLGIEMKTNHPFYFDGNGKTFKKLGFQAAFLSIGAHRSLNLNIEGKHLDGILSGLEFLRRIHTGRKNLIGERVLVVGGGNVAMDVSRSAWRLGTKQVQMVCIESRREMPAIPEEVEEAIREGVKIQFLASPIRIIGKEGKAIGMEFMRMGLSGVDDIGKKQSVPAKGSTFRVYADTIITAIGQRVNRKVLKGLDINQDGTVRVDPETGETSMKGVFAGGDMVTGPGWAIDAIADGKKGAKSIEQYLS